MSLVLSHGYPHLSNNLQHYFYISICFALNRLNTSRPRQIVRYFSEGISKFISWHENCCTIIQNSLKHVPAGPNEHFVSRGSDNDFVPINRTAIIWINNSTIYWYIYASLCRYELIVVFSRTFIIKIARLCLSFRNSLCFVISTISISVKTYLRQI